MMLSRLKQARRWMAQTEQWRLRVAAYMESTDTDLNIVDADFGIVLLCLQL